MPGEFHGKRNLAGYSPGSHKELDMTEQLTFHFTFQPEVKRGKKKMKKKSEENPCDLYTGHKISSIKQKLI